DDVRADLADLRADPRVAADRVGLWFFSMGGLLMASVLGPVPDGVVAVGGTYPYLADPDLDGTDLTQAVDVAATSAVPLLLVRPRARPRLDPDRPRRPARALPRRRPRRRGHRRPGCSPRLRD